MLRVVTGDGQTDTVLATLAQPLIVEVRDSTGRMAGGRAVRFTSLSDDIAERSRATARVTPNVDEGFGFDVSDTTDANGHAKAFLRYSIIAGTARVVVAVPDFQVADTVSFTVIPGTRATFSLAPHDTTVPPGASYSLRVTVADRFRNRIENVAPTFTVTAAAVSPSGQVTVDTAIGRASVVASYQGLTDTASATIFPRVPMVGKWIDYNGGGGVYSLHPTAPASRTSFRPRTSRYRPIRARDDECGVLPRRSRPQLEGVDRRAGRHAEAVPARRPSRRTRGRGSPPTGSGSISCEVETVSGARRSTARRSTA